jgi:hypothetical protein
MANAVFDDTNPLTRDLWAYPDTGRWDPERNTSEFAEALPAYKAHGLDAVCVNVQGASPLGYYRAERVDELVARIRRSHPSATLEQVYAGLKDTSSQPWESGGFTAAGDLKPEFAARLARVIDAADANGMAVVLGLFYFGQDERLRDEAAVRRAVETTCDWVLRRGYANVVIEVNNECDVPRYEHEVLTPPHVHELISLARSVSLQGRRLLAGTSFTRRMLPPDAVVTASDFILLHGNGITDPDEVAGRVHAVRRLAAYRPMPVLYNEDDHFDFDRPWNHFAAALSAHAGWGYFDPGRGAGGSPAYGDYVQGYQLPPVNWGINTPRKQAFFLYLSTVRGTQGDE